MGPIFDGSPRMRLLLRVVAAVVGGYMLASAWIVFCGSVFPARVEAILAGVQISFAIYTAAIIWAFSPVSLARVWLGLLVLSAALAGMAALLVQAGL